MTAAVNALAPFTFLLLPPLAATAVLALYGLAVLVLHEMRVEDNPRETVRLHRSAR